MSHDPLNTFVGVLTPTVGLRNVGSYQVSGHPFLTGSTLTTGQEFQVDFPFVTKNITVIASGTTSTGPVLRVHFNSNTEGNVIGGHHFLTLEASRESATFDTKCTRLFITCAQSGTGDNGFELIASLTNIPTGNMYPLTGAGLTV